ncbi:MAG: hypothetical protein RLY43_2375, partial [Bacteroidota bacterium]
FLTNSLEEAHENQFNLFTQWLSQEANEANAIKKDTPVMCVIGNPPYSVSSNNKSPWIEKLTADYKKDLNERNIQPLSDDYIKFIRFGQHFIEKNGEGILAYISNNSFIDGLIHRQMRKNLLQTFDKIYILDLHGNSKKKETAKDGSSDQNVFDIMQGVSINIFVKTGKKKNSDFGKLFHYDILGTRNQKYESLDTSKFHAIQWSELNPKNPNYFFIARNLTNESSYSDGFKLDELFLINASGIKTERDHLTIQFEESFLNVIESEIIDLPIEDFRKKYSPKPDGRDWKISTAKDDLSNHNPKHIKVLYRPFDYRYSMYTGRSKGFMAYPRNEIMKEVIGKDNLILSTCRQQSTYDFQHVLASREVIDMCTVSLQTKETTYAFPLYLYFENGDQTTLITEKRKPNFDIQMISQIAKGLNHTFVQDDDIIIDLPTKTAGIIYPLNVFDYIYAILHSPSYRQKYKEFLKIDFPRVPYPTDAEKFWKLVAFGKELREIHLLESPKVNEYITEYHGDGDNIVGKPVYKNGSVYINEIQYFKNVPEVAWNFYIGGYQPAQKWLKDRKERELSYKDILHYQKIIVALTETDRIMGEIDKIEIV